MLTNARLSNLFVIALLLSFATACGDDLKKKPGFIPQRTDSGANNGGGDAGVNNGGVNNGGTNNGGTNNGGINNGATNNGLACGNGMLDPGETCDGNCPTSCNDGESCTTDTMVGSPATCDATCEFSPITACVAGDSCCPPGCTTSNDQDCACTPTTSCAAQGRECGSIDNGCRQESCGSCNTNETCVSGSCQAASDIGNACTSDSQCSEGCITESMSGWSGGYCTAGCQFDSDCGPGAHCFSDAGVCLASCSVDSDCPRSEFGCYDYEGDGKEECAPLATGTGETGDGCDGYSDCGGGEEGFCIRQSSGAYGGYCTRTCSTNFDCPNGHCSSDGVCVDTCSFDNDCRGTGYACYDSDDDNSDECWVAGTGTGDVGDSCTGVWQCDGDEFGACALDQDGFPGGYCLILCGAGEATCPAGSVCSDTGACFDTCTSSTSCRTGYQCGSIQTDAGATEDVCLPT